ncbi:MAG: hypothetical protein K0R37_427 [Arthrobacter sp.]|nr:hypothetical protein [Arthrobacter sp.]
MLKGADVAVYVEVTDVEVLDHQRAGLLIILVAVACEDPGPGFHEYFQSQSPQLLYRLRRRGDPPLALPAFPRYAQPHPPLPFERVQRRRLGGLFPLPGWNSRSGAAARSWLESMTQRGCVAVGRAIE